MTTVERAQQLADADDPVAAQVLLATEPWNPDAVLLAQQLEARTRHLVSREAYAAFYNEPAPERPFYPFELLAQTHTLMPRWGVVRAELLAHGARSVLELGAFDGFCALNLAMTVGVPCTTVDVNRAAAEECAARARQLNVPVTVCAGFVEDLDLPDRFDAVLAMEILEHVRDVDAVLAVAERHLTPGGRVYVSAPLTAPAHPHEREAREHVRLLDGPRMAALLTAPGRELAWYQRLRTPDGLHHCGAYELRMP